ncbi:DNA-binding protein WhiA [Caldinitratiruptor microaerophilus]|uniref:Probable cell division protein WhiA n=1 Tax=Caldinitratiruptor microaerophilus TaxID=671077 RepID=A0AA35CM04_9FIRM|nr:DNA-binding protein WhiA [Caldinitratiruptor microaerophilus]BDG61667.1 putative sporulation transcription regulator WhiA [Caldinitratiruptor microaerophilus]
MSDQAPFSAGVRDELSRVWPSDACDRRAELAGLVRAAGILSLRGGGQVGLTLETGHAATARKALRLLREEAGVRTEVVVERRRRLRKGLTFRVRVPPQPELVALLQAASILGPGGELRSELPPSVWERDCDARAFLRGFFLGAGWVSRPDRGHHLELTSPGPEVAEHLARLLGRLGLPARVARRRESVVVYVKEAAHVVRFLGLVGAHQQRLRYEDVRVLKEVKNRINREVNAEAANMQKTVETGARQAESIRRLAAAGLLGRLSPALREMAELRLQHPDLSLRELGELCHPPVGKSGANHRMRQILRLAAGLFPEGSGPAL